ncbi:hypothetical protein E2L06_04140 [Haloterrigena sp. H1]|uniref:ATP-binding protein n=1 Tax=Haloterrigena sp. H1 TaxID=2552943 RepID=UPI00110F0E70|nr:ATP-binding protein [Haloterrigena sp. H1]TMT85824.1 hypothetical protein E2L06_04140 [Haloterrigena sp. H1]
MSDYDSLDIKQLRNALQNEELPALRDAGLLSGGTIDYLETYRENYTPHQAPHHETGEPAYWYYNSKQYVTIVRREVGETLSKAVQDGNLPIIQHALGLAATSDSGMDFLDYEILADLIEEPSLMLLLFGDTGSGKTYTAVRLSELWEFRVGGTILTNVESLAEANDGVVYVHEYPDIIHYCLEHPNERKLLIADELSSLMSGYPADRHYVETYMRPLVRKMRKEPFRLSIIGIGHRPGDIHPTMNNPELAYFGFKKGDTKEQAQKHMVVYERLTNEEGKKEDKKCDVQGIGLPNMTLDTNDNGNWDWGTEEEVLDAAYALRDAGYGDMLRLIRNLEEDDDGEGDESVGQSDVDTDELALRIREDEYLQMNENGQSYSDISEATGTPKSTVGDMIQRARSRVESSD